jgi:predicted DNA binding CopG/RHH family protein
MPTKKVSMSAKPGRSAKPTNVDDWVESRGGGKAKSQSSPDEAPAKMKRLTLDITESLHKAIKSRSVEDGVSMVDMLRTLLEENYGKK